MIQTQNIRPLETISDLGEVGERALGDVFSQKIGPWAFATPSQSTHNESFDIPSRFAITPPDGVIMSYLEEMGGQIRSLPSAHLYDGALESVMDRVRDPAVKALLQQDLELRSYLRARKIGEIYE